MRRLLVAFALLASHSIGLAAAQDHHAVVPSDTLKWRAAPASLPPGGQLAVLSGDPTKEGFYVVRLKVPAGYRLPPHMHPNDENVTVLSGTFHVGTGEKFDRSKGVALRVGGYARVAKGMAHYAWFSEDSVIQLHGQGPQGITYVSPADDPRKQ